MHQQWFGMVDATGAAEFLAVHTTTKIVVIIDTHWIEESRSFLWRGDKPKDYEAYGMDKVGNVYSEISSTHLTYIQLIRDCIPEQV